MPTCAFVSFRLGLADGVSVVAETWIDVFRSLGFDVVSVAGEGPVDRTVPGLELGAAHAPSVDEIDAALADADLVVAENLLTIPLNLPASKAVAECLRGRPALLHHHDPPWQRDHLAHLDELPVDDPAWAHVTINRLTEREMRARGFAATTIYNGFREPAVPGDRAGVRARLGVGERELLVVHPVRAIARKGVGTALELTAVLGGTYWLPGPAEDGYDGELARLIDAARCRVVRDPVEPSDRRDGGDRPAALADLYAAADLVAFPSTWEGFGNPPIEAAFHRRPVAVGPYPVGYELHSHGFEWFDAHDPAPIAAWLRERDDTLLDRNLSVARRHFSTGVVAERIEALLRARGWLP